MVFMVAFECRGVNILMSERHVLCQRFQDKKFYYPSKICGRLGLTDESEFDNNEVLKRCIRSFKKE
jgi:hypothetical protein